MQISQIRQISGLWACCSLTFVVLQ